MIGRHTHHHKRSCGPADGHLCRAKIRLFLLSFFFFLNPNESVPPTWTPPLLHPLQPRGRRWAVWSPFSARVTPGSARGLSRTRIAFPASAQLSLHSCSCRPHAPWQRHQLPPQKNPSPGSAETQTTKVNQAPTTPHPPQPPPLSGDEGARLHGEQPPSEGPPLMKEAVNWLKLTGSCRWSG